MNRSTLKVLLFFFLIIGSSAIVLLKFNYVIECTTEKMSKNISPDGEFLIYVYGRKCGSTEGYTTHISLLESTAKPPTLSGNILALDSNYGLAPADDLGIVSVDVDWVSAKHVALSFDKESRIFRSIKKLKEITIEHNLRE